MHVCERACAQRRVVFSSMWGISDIPDWCLVEACGLACDPRAAVPTAEQMQRMWDCSPMARPLQGGESGRGVPPILFLLGKQDRRVPPFQGLHMAESLRQVGSTARVLSFPDDCHPLSGVEAEMESWVATLMFFIEHSNADGRLE